MTTIKVGDREMTVEEARLMYRELSKFFSPFGFSDEYLQWKVLERERDNRPGPLKSPWDKNPEIVWTADFFRMGPQ